MDLSASDLAAAGGQIPGSAEEMLAQQRAQQQQKQQKEMIMDQILESSAKDRLVRLALVKPDFVSAVEDSLISAAQNGQLRGKVTDEQLKVMLEQMSDGDVSVGGVKKSKKVVVQRRKYDMDEEEDDDDSDLL